MNDEKEPKSEGNGHKRVSDRKLTANRQNAQRSTGPRTRAGKARAKLNSLKHGLSGAAVLIKAGDFQEDPQEFEQLHAGLREHYQPVGMLEDVLVEKIAGCLWRDRRVWRFEAGAIQREVDRQRALEPARGQSRLQDALDDGEDLEESSGGILCLMDGLDRVIGQVAQGQWTDRAHEFLSAHFKSSRQLSAALPEEIGHLPDDAEREQLVRELEAERERLAGRMPIVQAREAQESEARMGSYTLPADRDLDLVLRYAAAIDRQLHKAMGQLRQVQADRRAAEAEGSLQPRVQ